MKEGRKPEYLEKTPGDELQKMPHITAWRFKPQARLKSAQQHWWHWQAKKADMLLHHASPLALVAGQESRHAKRYTTRRTLIKHQFHVALFFTNKKRMTTRMNEGLFLDKLFQLWLGYLVSPVLNRCVGLVVKASTSRAEDPGFNSRLRLGDFSRLNHNSEIGTPMATLPPGVTGSVLGLVGLVSVYCDRVR